MASHDQLKEQLLDMGFEAKLIDAAISLLKENATLDSVLESIESGKAAEYSEKLVSNPEAAEQAAKPLTPEEAEAKKKAIEDKIKQRREAVAKEEAEAERQRELLRRQEGKGVNKLKDELETLQQQRFIDSLKKEKDEAKAAREAILRQIELDKADRKNRMSQTTSAPVQVAAPLPTKISSTPSKDGKTKLAIRLLDGAQIIQEFEERETLGTVRAFVVAKQNYTENISFSMPPMKPFVEKDMETSLYGLGLAPNARITVVRRP